MTTIELTELMSDIISFHPSSNWNAPDASETLWGAIDDAEHLEIASSILGEMRKRNIRFRVHALQGRLVADVHFPANLNTINCA